MQQLRINYLSGATNRYKGNVSNEKTLEIVN